MSKARNKKVTLNQLNNHTTTNKRQAMKDLKMLNFDELQGIYSKIVDFLLKNKFEEESPEEENKDQQLLFD